MLRSGRPLLRRRCIPTCCKFVWPTMHPESGPHHQPRRFAVAATALLVLIVLAVCETAAWPFLAVPAERWLSQRLERRVALTDGSDSGFRLHLLGGIDLQLARLRIEQPRGFSGEPMVEASAVALQLRWSDLLRGRRGEALLVHAATAGEIKLNLQRDASGLANWQLRMSAAQAADKQLGWLFRFDRLSVERGTARLVDVPLQLELDAHFGQQEGAQPGATTINTTTANTGVIGSARGSLRQLPVQARLRTGSAIPWLSGDSAALSVPLKFELQLGGAELDFDGSARDLLSQRDLRGGYRVQGPSMADVGAMLRLTLPATARFEMRGRLTRHGTRWLTVVDEAAVGGSRLAGEFSFDVAPGARPDARPLLAGRLHGAVLLLQDLGPAIGSGLHEQPEGDNGAGTGRLLPARHFDLATLRAMNATVLVDIAQLDLGTPLMHAAAPLRAHLMLDDGVLRIDGLDARLAEGQLSGQLRLDGRTPVASWAAELQLRGLQLEQAWSAPQRAGDSPDASGLLAARATLSGRGRSTAEWLASADGRVLVQWTEGTVSHARLAAVGVDKAVGMGVLLPGDDALKVDCGVADLRVREGLVTPQVMVMDTRDSLLWFSGGLSFGDERLDLLAQVQPKDFSPSTLRTPLRMGGTLAAPVLTLEKGPLLGRVLPAALLAMVNPLAALLPLLDPGQAAPAAAPGCQALQQLSRSGPRP